MPILFDAFLWTVPVGAGLFVVAWLLSRRFSGHITVKAVVLSSFAALALTPTVMNFCGQDYIAPASFTSLMIFAPDPARRSVGFIHGILPLLAFAAAAFFLWRCYVDRKRKVAS
jgi:hypothetical protein